MTQSASYNDRRRRKSKEVSKAFTIKKKLATVEAPHKEQDHQ